VIDQPRGKGSKRSMSHVQTLEIKGVNFFAKRGGGETGIRKTKEEGESKSKYQKRKKKKPCSHLSKKKGETSLVEKEGRRGEGDLETHAEGWGEKREDLPFPEKGAASRNHRRGKERTKKRKPVRLQYMKKGGLEKSGPPPLPQGKKSSVIHPIAPGVKRKKERSSLDGLDAGGKQA